MTRQERARVAMLIGGRTGDAERAVMRADFEWRHAVDRA
jgi:hypothetical protein